MADTIAYFDTVLFPKFSGSFVNCPLEFVCSADWWQLEPTERIDERHCSSCQKVVRFCTTMEQLEDCSKKGLCVAFYEERTYRPPDRSSGFRVGIPSQFIEDGLAIPRSTKSLWALDSL